MDHQAYLAQQDQVLGELIEEGVENQIAVTATIATIATAASFAKTHGPMIAGVAGVVKNVIWGE